MNAQVSFFFVAFALCLSTEAAVSNKRKCVDENCTVPISTGKTLVKYSAPELGYLSFRPGEEITIYSKEAGSNLDLWGVELKGKRGYVPKRFVKELKFLNKPKLLVDTEIHSASVPSTNISEPDTIIIDGTTLYNDISPSSTQEPHLQQQSTAVPEPEKLEIDDKHEEIVKRDDNKILTTDSLSEVAKEGRENNNGDVTREEGEDDIAIENEDDEEDDDDDDEDGYDDDNDDEEMEESTDQNVVDQTNDKSVDINVHNGTTEEQVVEDKQPDKKQNVIEKIHSQQPVNKLDNQQQLEKVDNGIMSEPGVLLLPESSSFQTPPPIELQSFLNQQQQEKTDGGVKREPAVLPVTEAPPIQTSSPTKLPLFFHRTHSDGQVPGMPAFGTVQAEPSSEADVKVATPGNLETKQDSQESMSKEPVEINIENELDHGVNTVQELENPHPNNENTIEAIGVGLPLEDPSANMSKPGIVEPVRASAEEKLPEDINDSVSSTPSTSLFDDIGDIVQKAIERNLNTQVSEIVDETKPSVNVNTEEAPTTTEAPGLFGFFSEAEPSTPTPDILSTEEVQLIPDTNEPDMVNILDERLPNGDEIEVDSKTDNFAESPPSWSYNEYDATTESPKMGESDKDEPNQYEEATGNEGGWFDSIMNMFSSNKEEESIYVQDVPKYPEDIKYEEVNDDVLLSQYASHNNQGSCPADDVHCHSTTSQFSHSTSDSEAHPEAHEEFNMASMLDMFEFSDTLMIVAISGACVIVFLWGYMIIEKMRKEGPLVGKINHLEQQLQIMAKENEVLSCKVEDTKNSQQEINENVSSELVLELQKELNESHSEKLALEEQISSLEKELENSTEVGLELNKMLSDVINSQNGSDTVMANIEQLQKQLVEQQSTINSVNEKLNEKYTENHELQLELEINNKKVVDLQAELEKMMLNLIKAEEEKEVAVSKTESEVIDLREKLTKIKASSSAEITQLTKQLEGYKSQLAEAQRNFEVKAKEYNLLKDALSDSDANKNIVDLSTLKAEVQQLQQDNKSLVERLGHEQIIGKNSQSEVKHLSEEKMALKKQYEEADREKLEALTRLEVLSSYFKEKEAELQRELSKHEAMWSEKQGESTTASERMKFMQEEIQNFKSQVASLQQEIVSQEVDLKSQISVLEKKAHENWVAARQAERRVEEARQEAAQLRNRLTLRERSLIEEKSQNRNGLSPLETNGVDHHLNDTASPPLLFGNREHMTTSPPLLPGLPPGFPLPPPPGVPPPFLPPFMPGMPPPPGVFPGDHRPPPLGRMSSPPLNSRYSPDSRAFSPYDRRSLSPTDDDYYDRDDRDYYNHRSKRNSGRRSGYSTGSNSNESLDKMDRSHSHSKV